MYQQSQLRKQDAIFMSLFLIFVSMKWYVAITALICSFVKYYYAALDYKTEFNDIVIFTFTYLNVLFLC